MRYNNRKLIKCVDEKEYGKNFGTERDGRCDVLRSFSEGSLGAAARTGKASLDADGCTAVKMCGGFLAD